MEKKLNKTPISSDQFSLFNDQLEDLIQLTHLLPAAGDGHLAAPNDDVHSHFYKIDALLTAIQEKISKVKAIGWESASLAEIEDQEERIRAKAPDKWVDVCKV